MFTYILMMIPAVLITLWASYRVKASFKKYSKVPSANGFTGFQAAREILDRNGLQRIRIEETKGFLGDHFDSGAGVLRLSPDVYRLNSLSSIGVAAHEAGHAIQQAKNYSPLALRQALVPVTQFSSTIFNVLIFAGVIAAWLFSFVGLIKIALIFLGVTVIFSIITLPVEFNASSRARKLLMAYGIVSQREDTHIATVLNAAALTYVAAAASAIITLLYYVFAFLDD